MKQRLLVLLFLLVFATTVSSLVWASDKDSGGEGYAPVKFRDLSQAIALMGGIDITNPEVVDEYSRLFYCDQYQQNFKNDLELYKLRKMIVAHLQEKKIYFRTLYETSSSFQLGRYDTEGQFFPLSEQTAMVNVGSLTLTSGNDWREYCGVRKPSEIFPAKINLVLSRPLNLTTFRIPLEQAKKLLTRMAEQKNSDRTVYGRIRVRALDVSGLGSVRDRGGIRSELKGDVIAIEFFLDKEMTQPVGPPQMLR
jgi:hypothetical protein